MSFYSILESLRTKDDAVMADIIAEAINSWQRTRHILGLPIELTREAVWQVSETLAGHNALMEREIITAAAPKRQVAPQAARAADEAEERMHETQE